MVEGWSYCIGRFVNIEFYVIFNVDVGKRFEDKVRCFVECYCCFIKRGWSFFMVLI